MVGPWQPFVVKVVVWFSKNSNIENDISFEKLGETNYCRLFFRGERGREGETEVKSEFSSFKMQKLSKDGPPL